MFKKISVICLLAAISIFLAGNIGCTKKRPEKFEEKLGQIIDKMSGSLDLTESQKLETARIKQEILKKNKEMWNAGANDAGKTGEAFTKQIKSEKFNEAELNKLLDDQNTKREEMRKFMIGQLAKFHAILTPAQRVKFANILKEIGPGHRSGSKHERRGGPRPGEMTKPGEMPAGPQNNAGK